MSDPSLQIRTKRLILRLAQPNDLAAVLAYQKKNKRHLAPFEPLKPQSFFTRPFWKVRIRRSIEEFAANQSVRFFLFKKERPDEVIGTLNFTQIVSAPFHACYMGYGLAEKEQGNGYMREAVTAGVAFMFKELGIHRIMANYIPKNVRSGKLLQACGFVKEGYAKEYLLIAGKWSDHILTSKTNRKWKRAKSRS